MRQIEVTDDFDLDKIALSGQCFRWQEMRNGGYRIPVGGRSLTIRKAGPPGLYDVSEWNPFWENYFDFATNYAGIRSRIPQEDRYLYTAAQAGKGIRILRQDPWETFITFIISQRKSIPAIKGCVEKICRAAGTRKKDFYAFPTQKELAGLSMEDLKSCGLGYRAKYIYAAAANPIDIDRMQGLDDEHLMQKLLKYPGVGTKVASCTMLFGFHRLNLFPKDVWINRVLEEHYPDGFPFERYSPYCGVMQQYLFYYRRMEQ